MIFSPKKSATSVPMIKKGANGNSLFNPYFLKYIKIIPSIAPKKKDKNKPTKIFGKPNKSPNKIANLTSPKPIHAPLDIKKINKKNPDAIIDAIK